MLKKVALSILLFLSLSSGVCARNEPEPEAVVFALLCLVVIAGTSSVAVYYANKKQKERVADFKKLLSQRLAGILEKQFLKAKIDVVDEIEKIEKEVDDTVNAAFNIVGI